MTLIRVLIADDHLLVREGLQTILADVPDIIVAGEARTSKEAIERCRVLMPDVVLMDIQMPGIHVADLGGVEATREILRQQPNIKIVALTAHMDEVNIIEVIKAGAVGVWTKDVSADELVRIVRKAHAGDHPVHPQAMEPLLRARRNPDRPSELDRLSERERDVLHLLGQGLSNRDIAEQLNLSEATVKGHVSRILSKLKIKNRAQAALHAARLNH